MVQHRILYSRCLVILLVTLLLPVFTHAYTVDSATLLWNGYTVKTIAPDKSLDGVTLQLRASSDLKDCFDPAKYQAKACYITLDASNLSTVPSIKTTLKQTVQIRDRCRPENASNPQSAYLCTIPPFSLTSTTPANTISLRFKIDTTTPPLQTFNIPLVIDNTAPTLASIKTGYCDDTENGQVCYVTSGASPFSVSLSDAVTSFEYKLVFLGASTGVVGIVSNCTGSTCTGTIPTLCQDGQELNLQLVSVQGVNSKEDAQNLVVAGNPQPVRCSLHPLELVEWKGGTSDATIAGQPVPQLAMEGGTITYEAIVRSNVGAPVGYVNATAVSTEDTVSADCSQDPTTQDPQVYSCKWRIGHLLHNDTPQVLKLFATDAIGNSLVSTSATVNTPTIHNGAIEVSLKVFNTTAPTGGKPLHFFNAQLKGTLPANGINRAALDIASRNSKPYPFYVQYGLARNPSYASKKVFVVYQQLDKCWYKLPNETNYSKSSSYDLFSQNVQESKVFDPRANYTKLNRLDLAIRAPQDVLKKSNAFTTTCQVRLVVQQDNSILSVPQIENVTFNVTFRGTKLGEPGAQFVQKIKSEEDYLNSGTQQLLIKARRLLATAQSVCKIESTMNTVNTMCDTVSVVGAGLMSAGVTYPAGNPTLNVGDQCSRVVTKIQGVTFMRKNGFIGQMCDVVSCRRNNYVQRAVGELPITDWMKTALEYEAKADAYTVTTGRGAERTVATDMGAQLTSNIRQSDPSNSIIMSTAGLCVPGIIAGLGRYQDINCDYLACLKQQSTNAGSVVVCDNIRAYKRCSLVFGELFELPFARVVKNLAANTNAVIQNLPGFLAKYGVGQLCARYFEPNFGVRWTPVTFETACAVYSAAGTTSQSLNFGMDSACNSVDPTSAGACNNKGVQDWACIGCTVAKGIMNYLDYAQRNKNEFHASATGTSNSCGIAQSNTIYSLANRTQTLSFAAWVKNEQLRHEREIQGMYAALCPKGMCVSIVSNDPTSNRYIVGPKPAGMSQADYNNAVAAWERDSVDASGNDLPPGSMIISRETAALLASGDPKTVQATQEMLKSGVVPTDPDQVRIHILLTSPPEQIRKAVDVLKGDVDCKSKECDAAREDLKKNGYSIDEHGQIYSNDAKNRYDAAKNAFSAQQIAIQNAYNTLSVKDVEVSAAREKYDNCMKVDPQNCDEFKTVLTASERERQELANKYDAELAKGSELATKVTEASNAYTAWDPKDIGSALRANANKAFNDKVDGAGTFVANFLYEKGLLQWMSLANAGEWGRRLSEWTTVHADPEQWKRSLCNAQLYNINDNDPGNRAIYQVGADGQANIVGTFAAERREMTNESGTYYLYLFTMYVTNPKRAEQHPADKYIFGFDANFLNPTNCNDPECATRDLIYGRFNLQEGSQFDQAKNGFVISSPYKYTRFCLYFTKNDQSDEKKPFPDALPGTHDTYCRNIVENAFGDDDPVPPAVVASSGSGTSSSGTGGTGGPSGPPSGTLIP